MVKTGFGPQTPTEPLGSLTQDEKVKCTTKIHLRRIGDESTGTWIPEFCGDIITRRDINLIIRSLTAGHRRWQSMFNLRRRQKLSDETKVEVVKKDAEKSAK